MLSSMNPVEGVTMLYVVDPNDLLERGGTDFSEVQYYHPESVW